MKKRMGNAGKILLMLLYMGVFFGCASNEKTFSVKPDSQRSEEYSSEAQCRKNEEKFYAEAENQGIDKQTAEAYLQILMDDNLFKDGKMELTGLRIDDIDGNGQMDMLVRVIDAQEKPFYGSGGLWFYMNEDEPYGFCEEQCPYYGYFDLFWEDIDNDENMEIVFWSQGTGVGATGDIYKAVFKYKNHAIEQMRLPSDLEEYSGEYGLYVEVIQEAEENCYTAYCPYFDERISFRAQNIEGKDLPSAAQSVGENVRGFCGLQVAEYQGKKALQASEYLKGEGGVVHYIATAQFLITWKVDGYYYYASQSDHYFLYRVKEDGSSPQCLYSFVCLAAKCVVLFPNRRVVGGLG